ncbi:hypothetical protein AB0N20_24460 [Streptomyces griseoincarnatus]
MRAGAVGEVPAHLRHSRCTGARELGNGIGYRYPHRAPGGVLAQQHPPGDLVGAAPSGGSKAPPSRDPCGRGGRSATPCRSLQVLVTVWRPCTCPPSEGPAAVSPAAVRGRGVRRPGLSSAREGGDGPRGPGAPRSTFAGCPAIDYGHPYTYDLLVHGCPYTKWCTDEDRGCRKLWSRPHHAGP